MKKNRFVKQKPKNSNRNLLGLKSVRFPSPYDQFWPTFENTSFNAQSRQTAPPLPPAPKDIFLHPHLYVRPKQNGRTCCASSDSPDASRVEEPRTGSNH